MTTETFAGGHGAPSPVAFYSPDQKRDPLGMWTKDDGGAEPMEWKKAIPMTEAQWGKLTDGQKAGLLAAVYAADASGEKGAPAALAKLQGWVGKGKGGKGGGGGGKAKKSGGEKKSGGTAKSEPKRAGVRPDAVNSGHRDGYVVGESEDGNTRMRWDKGNETYVVEKKDGKAWKEARRLKPAQAYNELAKATAKWYRPKVQPFLKPTGDTAKNAPKKKAATKSPDSRPGKQPGGKINSGRVDRSTAKSRPTTRGPQGKAKSDPITAAAEVHTGAMIALIPTEDRIKTLAMEGGEPPEQLHMTEIYLGDTADWSDEEREFVIDVISDFAKSRGPVQGDAFSVNMFNPPGSVQADGKDRDSCVVLGIGGDDVADFHDSLREYLEDEGVEYPRQHTPRIPHVTLMYTDDADLSYFTDKTGPITFDTIRVAFGGENYDIPLGEASDDDDDDVTAGAFKFDPKQPRDAEGQWTDGPGDSGWSGLGKNAGKVMYEMDKNGNKWRVVSKGEGHAQIQLKKGKKWTKYRDVKDEEEFEQNILSNRFMPFQPVDPYDENAAGDTAGDDEIVESDENEYAPNGYGHDPDTWDNLPESEAPDGWADGGTDPDVAVKERRETKKWTDEERDALNGYTVDATTYNNALRDGNGKKPRRGEYDQNGTDLGEATTLIDKAMYKLPRQMTVFRQATLRAFGVDSLEELKSLDGQVLKDFGYLSTSVNFKQNLPNGTHKSNIHIKIDVPKGKKAAYVADVSTYPEQNELMLARGSKLKFQSVEFKNGRAFVTMKVV